MRDMTLYHCVYVYLCFHFFCLLQFVCSMVHSYEKILAAHCREFQSWMLSHSNDNCRGLALYMIEDIFYAGVYANLCMSFYVHKYE